MKREKFSSRLGFILVSAGCAIGIGNVWKFPYMCGAYGGEEFIAVLPATSLQGASFVAEQMRLAISQLVIAHPGSPFGHVTASFGIASAVAMPETNPQDIVGAADLALYKAKNKGRNRVCQTSSLDPQ